MAKYMFRVSTGFVGSKIEEEYDVDDAELEGMSEDEIHNYIWDNHYMIWVQENADLEFYKIEEEE